MATSTFNATADNSTDANFRAWGSGISAGLAALGLIQTADTGQINWTTVLHPTVTSTAQGYEIWRLNDSLQSTNPFYFKIEYGSAAVANDVSIWITTGTGSNGSGSIVNPSTRFQFANQVNGSGPVTTYMSGDSGGFAMMLFGGTAQQNLPIFVCMERSKSPTGTDTGTYLAVMGASQTGTSNTIFWLHFSSNGQFIQEPGGNNIPGPYTKLTSTQATGNVTLIPVLPCFGFFNYPLRRVISGLQGDWTNGDSPQISLYSGITDSYMVFKIGAASGTNCTSIFGPNGGNASSYVIIMRYQ